MSSIKLFAVMLITTLSSLAWANFMKLIQEPISGFILSWGISSLLISMASVFIASRQGKQKMSQWNWFLASSIFLSSLLGIYMAQIAGNNYIGDSSLAGMAWLGGLINGSVIGAIVGIVIIFIVKRFLLNNTYGSSIQSGLDGLVKGVYSGIIFACITFVTIAAFGPIIPKDAYWNALLEGLLEIIFFSPVVGGLSGLLSRALKIQLYRI